jgi:hypothetical protein
VLNSAPRHEDVLWEWRHSSTHSKPRHYMDVRSQLHGPAALLSGKQPSISIGYFIVLFRMFASCILYVSVVVLLFPLPIFITLILFCSVCSYSHVCHSSSLYSLLLRSVDAWLVASEPITAPFCSHPHVLSAGTSCLNTFRYLRGTPILILLHDVVRKPVLFCALGNECTYTQR